jgi:CRP-like cAMP-binding protein
LETLAAEVDWEVLEPGALAILDDSFFTAAAGRWPQVAGGLITRATERARLLAFQHAASHVPGLTARLGALLWSFAERWGRVTPDGVLVPIRLTHQTLSELVGAARPSVSTALKQLEHDGIVERRQQGWLLRGTGSQRHGSARAL